MENEQNQGMQNDKVGNIQGQSLPNMAPEAAPTTHGERSFGPIIGIVIIVLVLALGGFYFWGQRIVKEGVLNEEGGMEQMDAAVNSLNNVSSSDELDAIEGDVDATNLDSLDDGLGDIDSSLE